MAAVGFKASVALTLLGISLGALIRSSTTLIPAHYHASLGAVTAAFMAGVFLVIEAVARDAGRLDALAKLWHSARRQIVLFGAGQSVFAIGFGIGGIYGLGRKAYAAEQHVRSTGELVGIGIMGIGGLVAVIAGLWFLTLVIGEMGRWGGRAANHSLNITPTNANS
jgi:cytochrome c oxidase subunit 1